MTIDAMTRVDPSRDAGEVTRLLKDWYDGDDQAPSRLLPLIYEDLRRTARAFARSERKNHTLQPTAVVHEAWIQMVGSGVQVSGEPWQSREHFLGTAAHAMRRVLVDYARHRGRIKRGAKVKHVPLFDETEVTLPSNDGWPDLYLAVNQALERLEQFAPQEARVVELRFFGGLTLEQTADQMGVSRRTVVRTWRRAKAWLQTQFEEGSDLDS